MPNFPNLHSIYPHYFRERKILVSDHAISSTGSNLSNSNIFTMGRKNGREISPFHFAEKFPNYSIEKPNEMSERGENSGSSNLSPRRESLTRSDAILDGRDDLPFDTGERRGQLVQRYTVGIRYFRRVSWPRDPRLLSVCTAGSPRERSKRMSDVKCSHPGFIRRTDVPNPLKSQRHSRDIYHNSR